MATAVWQDVDGDWNNTSNWTGGAGTGGVPANNDTAVIASGTVDITDNLTTGLTGITLKIGSGYTGSIGTSSTWLDIDGGLFEFSGGGTSCYMAGTWTNVRVNDGIASPTMLSWRNSSATALTNLKIRGGQGTVTVNSNGSLVTYEMVGADSASLVIDASVSGITTGLIETGRVTISSNCSGTTDVLGGVLTIDGAATVGTLEVHPSGVVVHKTSGAMTTTNLYGRIDGRENTNSSATFTTLNIFEGAELNIQSGLGNFLFSNPINYNGGVALFHPGSSITVS
jgi:hypothetical protein